ncbi:MAG: chemotaxis protein methyltransferase CheR, partial [Shewanella psychromarinicola]
MDILNLSDKEFSLFKRMIYDIAGINLSENKKALVSSRLAKRVKYFGLKSYSQYFELLQSRAHNEYQIAIDLL